MAESCKTGRADPKAFAIGSAMNKGTAISLGGGTIYSCFLRRLIRMKLHYACYPASCNIIIAGHMPISVECKIPEMNRGITS
jgi:hypothetical protein